MALARWYMVVGRVKGKGGQARAVAAAEVARM